MTPSPTSGPTAPPPDGFRIITPTELRRRWRAGEEVALLDVREEGPYSLSHPFFAVSLPLSQIELRILDLVPRLNVPVVVYDDGEGYAARAVPRIHALGYTDVAMLAGGLSGYARHGEVFRDVNVPSKAFGELVEAIRHTPSLSADEAKALIERESNLVVLDARRFEEYRTMSIPRGVSVPGGELAFRAREVAPSPDTTIIVNCAGRTRSIIGTQSLINAGLPNKIYALRNGTIGWTLAGHQVERGKTARVLERPRTSYATALADAKAWAERVGVGVLDAATFARHQAEAGVRTLYCLDVRTPEEHAAGHPTGFASAPGGQLVQATDEWVGVRGARLVLFDDDGVRARMTASWLKQMGWDVAVVGPDVVGATETEIRAARRPPLPQLGDTAISAEQLAADPAAWTIVDLTRSPSYKAGHIPGAHFVLASRFADDLAKLPGDGPIVLTSNDGSEAAFALADARAATTRELRVLTGGTRAWTAAGHVLESDRSSWISLADDVYKRPYEGTDNAAEAMQAYIDWELQLVAQLANDSVSNFHVV
ncbi:MULTISPECIES: rhodanese-like domain-containing protein [unclassified Bradyrhizobium]|uniref:rhodanese-like domain-containing protein n=1 Tax=unclassified Bradyrhizobium TaxID=2631580 RepID=UPI0028EE8FAC|nr:MULTISPECIES: rhodanese-like domain-containing protein [unclassified Bradyrhizobium]